MASAQEIYVGTKEIALEDGVVISRIVAAGRSERALTTMFQNAVRTAGFVRRESLLWREQRAS